MSEFENRQDDITEIVKLENQLVKEYQLILRDEDENM